MIKDDIKKKILEDRDFINVKRYDFSLKKLLESYPDGVPEELICRALDMTSKEVHDTYLRCVVKLKNAMKVDFSD